MERGIKSLRIEGEGAFAFVFGGIRVFIGEVFFLIVLGKVYILGLKISYILETFDFKHINLLVGTQHLVFFLSVL